jgi:ubiquinone/menaquinone biosynthesis C-methylase UbiE
VSTLYDQRYARRYRAHDDELDTVLPYLDLVRWLQAIAADCPPGFTALDLGCGTGRYFWAVSAASRIVAVDASAAMLAEARQPVHADRITAETIEFVHSDLSRCEFEPNSFDLVYSIGVLAEHAALDLEVVRRVHRWLRAGGRFAFTTVHLDSPSVPKTMLRRLARGASTLAPVRERLLSGGLYADERRVRDLLHGAFVIERLERFESESHLHCRCVARKVE